MRHLAMALLLACGGQVETSSTDTMLAYSPPVVRSEPRGWCCDDTLSGKPILTCGYESKPVGSTCYCAGIASGDACEQTQPYVPGSTCGQSDLVCW